MRRILVVLFALMILVSPAYAVPFAWDALRVDVAPVVGVMEQTLGQGFNEPLYFYEPEQGLTFTQKVRAFTPDISFTVENVFERYMAYSTQRIPADEWVTIVATSTLDGTTMIVKMKNADIQAFANREITQVEIRRRTVFIYNGTKQ